MWDIMLMHQALQLQIYPLKCGEFKYLGDIVTNTNDIHN